MENTSYFKVQLSSLPLENIFCVDVFKDGFLKLSERLTCYDRRIRDFGENSESLIPASGSASVTCMTIHESPEMRAQKRAPGRTPIHCNTCAPPCPREPRRTPALKV